ncbi:hypothetical protein L7F22_033904 [Adiantum nelumboides]|nr:hypothetical protein [Adiantum nelumboides]
MSSVFPHLRPMASPTVEDLQSSSIAQPRVIIVGAGMSGLSAAHHLATLAPDQFNITILEASDRAGGRICSSTFDGELVEMGATWIHGIEGSPIHDIAQRMRLMHGDSPWECMDGFPESPVVVAEGGVPVPSHIVDCMGDLYRKLYAVIQYTDGGLQQFSECDCGVSIDEFKQLRKKLKGASVGEYLWEGFKKYVAMQEKNVANGTYSNGHGGRKLSSEWNVEALREGVFRMRENVERSVTAAGSMNDLDMDSNDEYWEYPGEHKTIGHGYSSIIQYLAASLPEKIIQFNKQVSKIAWFNSLSAGPVHINCEDGTSYEAEHVIVTVSLGILKAEVPSALVSKSVQPNRLFHPPLPAWKLSAISKLGFGVVDKCFLSMKPTLPGSVYPHMQLVFKEDGSYNKLSSAHIPWWMQKNFSFYPIHGSSHVVCTWLTGEEAVEMERFSNDEVIVGIVRTMRAFGYGERISDFCADCKVRKIKELGAYANLQEEVSDMNGGYPSVKGLLRSQWGSNPLFRGSYSYVAVGSTGEDIDAVAEPLPRTPADGMVVDAATDCRRPLQLLFAGEATHRYCYSTTHGAYLSGVREAERLAKHYGLMGT